MEPISRFIRIPAREGVEATVGGSGKAVVRYSLEKTVRFDVPRPALEIGYTLSGRASLEIFAERAPGKPFLSLDMAQGPGEIRWSIPLPAGFR
jgi:hypothetical protein